MTPRSMSAWQKADAAMSGLARGQLLEDDVEQRLVDMFGVDEVRVFSGHEVKFECRCSRERVANVLRSLGVEEVRSVIAEQGTCTVTCEFCQKPYKFDAIDVEHLFDGAGAARQQYDQLIRAPRTFGRTACTRSLRLGGDARQVVESPLFARLSGPIPGAMRHRIASNFDLVDIVARATTAWRSVRLTFEIARVSWHGSSAGAAAQMPEMELTSPSSAMASAEMPAACNTCRSAWRPRTWPISCASTAMHFFITLGNFHQIVGHHHDARWQRERVGADALPNCGIRAGTGGHRRAAPSCRRILLLSSALARFAGSFAGFEQAAIEHVERARCRWHDPPARASLRQPGLRSRARPSCTKATDSSTTAARDPSTTFQRLSSRCNQRSDPLKPQVLSRASSMASLSRVSNTPPSGKVTRRGMLPTRSENLSASAGASIRAGSPCSRAIPSAPSVNGPERPPNWCRRNSVRQSSESEIHVEEITQFFAERIRRTACGRP